MWDSGNGDGMNTELSELFLDELAAILNAETQLTQALPKMAKAAVSDELVEAFRSHLEQTKNHVNRLEEVFASLGEKVRTKTCPAMKGLIEEGEDMMNEFEDSSALDAGLIAGAQKVEHYEIAAYGTLKTWAEQMGHTHAAELFQATLEEEQAADAKLSQIAESIANHQAR